MLLAEIQVSYTNSLGLCFFYLQFLSDAIGCCPHLQNKLVSDEVLVAGDARESTCLKRYLA